MTIRAVSTPNIALIKYWGNRDDALRLPAADSLSITLDTPTVEVAITEAERFTVKSFSGELERSLSGDELARLKKHFVDAKEYLSRIGKGGALPTAVSLKIKSSVPRGIGIASSAAIFSALAEVYAGLASGMSRKDVSIMARLGSGSASRSVFGGFVAMISGEGEGVDASYAVQIALPEHWKLWDIIIAPSIAPKHTGSTEGHALVHTSPAFQDRLREMPHRQKECIEAIRGRDFEKLRVVSEEDCIDMHKVMMSSTPSLNYLSEETHRIIGEITDLRSRQGLAVLYTMDAGPTVHLICEQSALPAVREYARAQKNCTIFEAGIGSGSRLI